MALPYSSDCLSPPFATSRHLPFHSCSPSFYLLLSLAPSFYLSPALTGCRSALLHINFTRFTCAYPAQATCNIWRQFFCAHRQNIPECCQEGRERRCCLLSVCVCVWTTLFGFRLNAFVLSAFYLAYIKYAACRNRARDYMKNPKDFICV